MSLKGFPARPGGRYEEELVEHEIDWDVLHEEGKRDEFTSALVKCVIVLDTLLERHRHRMPEHVAIAAEVALDGVGKEVSGED